MSISLDGANLRQPESEAMIVRGPTYDAVVGGIVLQPGEQDHIHVAQGGTTVTYHVGASFSQAPHIEIGLNRSARDYKFSMSAPTLARGSAISMSAQPTSGELTVNATDVKSTGAYSLGVIQLPPSGRKIVTNRTVQISSGSLQRLQFTPGEG